MNQKSEIMRFTKLILVQNQMIGKILERRSCCKKKTLNDNDLLALKITFLQWIFYDICLLFLHKYKRYFFNFLLIVHVNLSAKAPKIKMNRWTDNLRNCMN